MATKVQARVAIGGRRSTREGERWPGRRTYVLRHRGRPIVNQPRDTSVCRDMRSEAPVVAFPKALTEAHAP